MRTTNMTLAVLMFLALSAVAVAEESLFSRSGVGSVYETPAETGSSGPNEAPLRVPGPATLSDMLRQAGLEPTEISTQVIAVKIPRDNGSIPILFTISEDRKQIRMAMLLTTLDEKQNLSAEKLTALLDANREIDQATFAYSAKSRRIELHRVLDNHSITVDKLRSETVDLVEIASRSHNLWNVDAASPAKQEEVAQAKPQAAAPAASTPAAAAPTLSLVGTWSSARSATQAFALQLKEDGSFNMVVANGGKNAKSSGKYTISGSTLTLVDTKGTKLSGKVEQTSAKEFKFSPPGSKDASASVTFKRAT